jgi:hypothetical protein
VNKEEMSYREIIQMTVNARDIKKNIIIEMIGHGQTSIKTNHTLVRTKPIMKLMMLVKEETIKIMIGLKKEGVQGVEIHRKDMMMTKDGKDLLK